MGGGAGGAAVVVDPVGGPAAESALRALGAGGRFCVLGFASGDIPRLPANIVLLRNRSVIGVDWGDWARGDGPGALTLVADVLGRIGRGELHPPQPQTFPLADAEKVLRMFADRAVTGKIALVPQERPEQFGTGAPGRRSSRPELSGPS